jgi:hypothetical protein
VRKRIARNAENPVWRKAELRWAKLVEFAKGELTSMRAGEAHIRWQREAYQELERLGQHVEARAVVETVLALYLMAEHDSRRFRSDDAFRFQLVRRVRGLTEVNQGIWQDARSKRVKRVYRDSAPRATTYLAEMLAKTLGVIGLTVARMERDQAKTKEQERQELHGDLLNLK